MGRFVFGLQFFKRFSIVRRMIIPIKHVLTPEEHAAVLAEVQPEIDALRAALGPRPEPPDTFFDRLGNVIDVATWMTLMQRQDYQRIALESKASGEHFVSTTWIGTNSDPNYTHPTVFETAVYVDGKPKEFYRCDTQDYAIKMHTMVLTRTLLKTPKFELGRVVATPGALEHAQDRFDECLARHVNGDWGVSPDEDRQINDTVLRDKLGTRLMSAYPIDETKPCRGYGDNTLWIVTEADRSVTTLLLPDEY